MAFPEVCRARNPLRKGSVSVLFDPGFSDGQCSCPCSWLLSVTSILTARSVRPCAAGLALGGLSSRCGLRAYWFSWENRAVESLRPKEEQCRWPAAVHPQPVFLHSHLSVWWCHLPHVPLPNHRWQPPPDPGADGRERALPACASAVREATAGRRRSQVRPSGWALPTPEHAPTTRLAECRPRFSPCWP